LEVFVYAVLSNVLNHNAILPQGLFKEFIELFLQLFYDIFNFKIQYLLCLIELLDPAYVSDEDEAILEESDRFKLIPKLLCGA
jgi:hypothetical protein